MPRGVDAGRPAVVRGSPALSLSQEWEKSSERIAAAAAAVMRHQRTRSRKQHKSAEGGSLSVRGLQTMLRDELHGGQERPGTHRLQQAILSELCTELRARRMKLADLFRSAQFRLVPKATAAMAGKEPDWLGTAVDETCEITRAEFTSIIIDFLKIGSSSKSDIAKLFNALDEDGGGTLDIAELDSKMILVRRNLARVARRDKMAELAERVQNGNDFKSVSFKQSMAVPNKKTMAWHKENAKPAAAWGTASYSRQGAGAQNFIHPKSTLSAKHASACKFLIEAQRQQAWEEKLLNAERHSSYI
jgi:hypothetical protein